MTGRPPDLPREPASRGFFERASVVWLVPVAAVAIALAVAWQNYADRGPLIEIAFDDASGIRAGETDLRYRDVSVGLVEDVGFSGALDRVLVTVRLEDDQIAPYVDGDARFWVVVPEVTARGVEGLDTVLSGVFIEGVWDTDPGGFVGSHEGLASAPLVRAGERGLRIRLRAATGASLTRDAPILFKGIEVGRVGRPELLPGGAAAQTEAVIYEPYDSLVTTSTRFWDTSGFSFSIGAAGAELDFSSVASLIAGGVTFDTIVSGGSPVDDDTTFELFPDEASARSSLFADEAGPVVNVAVIFDENVSGLEPGAPVDLRGVEIGEVANVTGLIDPLRFRDNRVRLLATLEIRPSRMGLEGAGGADEALDFLAGRVEEGLRARLVSAGLLSGGLRVEFVDVEDAEAAVLDLAADPFPIIPTTDNDIADVTASAEGVLQRISDLPIEELLARANGFLAAATELVGDEELGRVPGEVTGLIEEVRGVTGSDAVQALPERLEALTGELDAVLAEVRGIVADPALDTVPEDVAGLLDDARGLVGSEAAQGLPAALSDVAAQLQETSAALDAILSDPATVALPGEATGLVDDMRAIAGSEALRGLPDRLTVLVGDLQAAAIDIRTVTADPAVAALPGEVAALVDEARGIAGDPAVQALPERLDGLLSTLDETAGTLNALVGDEALQRIPGQASGLLDDVARITGSPEAQALPETIAALATDLGTATEAFSGIVTDLRAAETVKRLTEAIDATAAAADGVSGSVEGVPELVDRLNSVAARAETLPMERVADELARALEAAREVLDSDAARGLPDALSAALDEVEAVLSDLRQGGTVRNVNSTLASASEAASAVEEAAAGLPALADRLDVLLTRTDVTLQGFDQDSEFGRSLRRVLREVEAAAEAVRSFTRALERNPNSLILGR